MKIRWLPAVLLLASATPLHAETYFDFQVGISNAPPPIIVAREEPKVVVVPDTRIYVVRDDGFRFDGDLFLLSGRWYACRGGYWYSARTVRGSYRPIDVRYVPREILRVPAKHWKHHPHGGPPGQTKKFTAQNQDRGGSKGKHGNGKKKS